MADANPGDVAGRSCVGCGQLGVGEMFSGSRSPHIFFLHLQCVPFSCHPGQHDNLRTLGPTHCILHLVFLLFRYLWLVKANISFHCDSSEFNLKACKASF